MTVLISKIKCILSTDLFGNLVKHLIKLRNTFGKNRATEAHFQSDRITIALQEKRKKNDGKKSNCNNETVCCNLKKAWQSHRMISDVRTPIKRTTRDAANR